MPLLPEHLGPQQPDGNRGGASANGWGFTKGINVNGEE